MSAFGGKADISRIFPNVRFWHKVGHSTTEFRCPLLGVKQTLVRGVAMSAYDPKRTSLAK